MRGHIYNGKNYTQELYLELYVIPYPLKAQARHSGTENMHTKALIRY